MPRRFAAAIALILAATSARAADPDFTFVDQAGRRADVIRATLERITLPDGFRIGLYALTPGARHLAVGPGGSVTFVGTTQQEVWAVTGRDGDGTAETVRNFAPSPHFSPGPS